MNEKRQDDFATDGKIAWPDGKNFVFTIFDDTDLATLSNVGPVYSFLHDLGFRTTKSCWPVEGDPNKGAYPGQTCESKEYLEWMLDLQAKGFEIGWHNATWHGLPRQGIIAAFERYKEAFGKYPTTAANHSKKEAIYWGANRLTGIRAFLYNLMTGFRKSDKKISRGHVEGDEYFWGDLCKDKIKYLRNFVYTDINTLKSCPLMPYHDPLKPYVNYWFASSDGNHVERFNSCISEENQDRLEAEGGACIMYTHLACGFAEESRLQPEFERLMARLSKKNGWFVPVGTLLDHLLAQNGPREITDSQRRRLEWHWLREKIFIGTN